MSQPIQTLEDIQNRLSRVRITTLLNKYNTDLNKLQDIINKAGKGKKITTLGDFISRTPDILDNTPKSNHQVLLDFVSYLENYTKNVLERSGYSYYTD